MAKKRANEVIFRIRTDVRRRYDSCPLEGPERYHFEMLLKEVMRILKRHEGLPPEAVAVEHERNRFRFSHSVLQVTYEREELTDAKRRQKQIIITVVGMVCERYGRPQILL